MKLNILTLAATMITIASAISTGGKKMNKSNCPDIVEITGHPVFERQMDGSYRNSLDATITQNEEDKAWFLMGLENHEVIVSFDADQCPTENKKWFQLNLTDMEYTEYNLHFH